MIGLSVIRRKPTPLGFRRPNASPWSRGSWPPADRQGRDRSCLRWGFADVNDGPYRTVRNTDNPGLYYGYFENRYGEQFVFTFDRATGTGTVSGGDLGWGDPKAFTRGLLDEALRSTQDLAAQVEGSDARSKLPVIDAALALGRLTGLTGKDEVIWLRACLEACTGLAERPGDHQLT